MVLWEPRLHGTAVGGVRAAGTEALHRDIFGLHSCERQAGSGRGCAKHTSLAPAVLGVGALHPAQSALTAFTSCSHQAASQPFYLRDVQTHLPLSISALRTSPYLTCTNPGVHFRAAGARLRGVLRRGATGETGYR